jgi:hypothetical protein
MVIGELCGTPTLPARLEGPTFSEVAKQWTDGELARDWPDHVDIKDSAPDERRIKALAATSMGMTARLLPSRAPGPEAFALDDARSRIRVGRGPPVILWPSRPGPRSAALSAVRSCENDRRGKLPSAAPRRLRLPQDCRAAEDTRSNRGGSPEGS